MRHNIGHSSVKIQEKKIGRLLLDGSLRASSGGFSDQIYSNNSNWKKSLRFRNLQEKLEKRNSHLKQSSCPLDVEKNVGECADSIGIATHHHIGKSYIIIHRDLTSWNSRVEALLIQFDIFKNLDGLMEITEQGV